MTTELLQRALDALERVDQVDADCDVLAPDLSSAVIESILELREALAQPVQPTCKCSMRTKLVGDGCAVCNPKLAAELSDISGDKLPLIEVEAIYAAINAKGTQ